MQKAIKLLCFYIVLLLLNCGNLLAQEEAPKVEPANQDKSLEKNSIDDMSTADFLAPRTSGQNSADGLFPSKEKTRVSIGSYLQMFVVLAFILFLIYLFFYLTKNKFRKNFMGINGIEVLAKSSLVPRQTLLLVRVGPRILVLNAMNDGNIRTLAEFSDQEEIDRLLSEINKSSRDNIFQSLLTRNKILYDEELPKEDKELDKIEKQTDRLQR